MTAETKRFLLLFLLLCHLLLLHLLFHLSLQGFVYFLKFSVYFYMFFHNFFMLFFYKLSPFTFLPSSSLMFSFRNRIRHSFEIMKESSYISQSIETFKGKRLIVKQGLVCNLIRWENKELLIRGRRKECCVGIMK